MSRTPATEPGRDFLVALDDVREERIRHTLDGCERMRAIAEALPPRVGCDLADDHIPAPSPNTPAPRRLRFEAGDGTTSESVEVEVLADLATIVRRNQDGRSVDRVVAWMTGPHDLASFDASSPEACRTWAVRTIAHVEGILRAALDPKRVADDAATDRLHLRLQAIAVAIAAEGVAPASLCVIGPGPASGVRLDGANGLDDSLPLDHLLDDRLCAAWTRDLPAILEVIDMTESPDVWPDRLETRIQPVLGTPDPDLGATETLRLLATLPLPEDGDATAG